VTRYPIVVVLNSFR